MFKTTLNYLKRTYNRIAGHFRQLYVFKKYPAVKELLKYSVAGNFSNLIDFGVYIYLTRTFSFWRRHYLTVIISVKPSPSMSPAATCTPRI